MQSEVDRHRTFCIIPNSQDLNPVDYAVSGEGSAAGRIRHSDFQFGQSQGQTEHLLGESRPTDHRQIY